jgi:signal transduction histidine kinase
MLLGPLIAHDNILGVIAVTRDSDAPPFTPREIHRLRAISDYAALALWKAELLERAQAADRAKSRFLATVSHELRTPLTALAGYEELLVDQVMGPLSESQLDVLERMRSVTNHLAAVIEEVLAFSSLDEGRETVRPTDFLAADLVRATVAVVEPLARQKGLTFESSVPNAAIRMTSDVDKVRQILVNLAGNAVKFTDHGEVRLDVARSDGVIRFTVRDTGIGIPAHDIDRLFKPFAQLDTTLTRRHGGTGLGLYISRGLAELLGGRIDVRSEVGKGSCFTLVLPTD